ncbi:Eco47II family restriction endonuclease [Cloacibacterium sp.]|uniref:Eco47II family restriction endonuclease n=1 Tax=Cloacibacterium sp. TaxID=1913682 RepID=UPI0035B27B79
MKNKYLNFISDEHFLNCIANLHSAYIKAKNNISKKSFYSNKVDTIKLTFDSKFNDIDEEKLIEAEILRQIDKSINNSIGTFHEQILGGIDGFEVGKLSGIDIKAKDETLFAVFGNSEIPKNISDAIFDKLANTALIFSKAKFYYVLLDDFSEINEKWIIGNEEYRVSQKRVFKISIKEFYNEITLQTDAFQQLQSNLTIVIDDYLETIKSKSY